MHWPLWPPLLVVLTSIPVVLAPSLLSIVVVSPTHCPLQLSYPCVVHCNCALLSITIELSSRHPLPSIAVALEVHCHCACTIPHRPSPLRSRRAVSCRQVAVAQSIDVVSCHPSLWSPHPSPSIAVNLSISVELSSCHPSLSIDLESIAVELPLRRPLPSTVRLFAGTLVAFNGVCVGVFADSAVLLVDNNEIVSAAVEGGSSSVYAP